MIKHREVHNVPYPEYSQNLEAQIVDSQYEAYPESVAEWPPPVTITGSISLKPGGYLADPLADPSLSFVDAGKTDIIFASGGIGDEYAVPVRSAWETNDIPHATLHEISVHAALALISSENLQSAAEFSNALDQPHTHRTTPHLGMFASNVTKLIYRKAQIHEPVPPHKSHHRYSSAEIVGEDGIGF